MNHLAHFLLSPSDDESRLGTLLADVVRGTDLSAWPEPAQQAIRLHRRIDATVDSHPLVTGLKPLMAGHLKRYGGILCDVFFDHALIAQWGSHAPVPLTQFTDSVYASLERTEAQMPPELRAISARMREFDALTSCATHSGVERTLARISRRLKRPVDLAAGAATLVAHQGEIHATFAQVWPVLQKSAASYLAGSNRISLPSELSVST
jgi:acyl carrier protein phosphodiesterase